MRIPILTIFALAQGLFEPVGAIFRRNHVRPDTISHTTSADAQPSPKATTPKETTSKINKNRGLEVRLKAEPRQTTQEVGVATCGQKVSYEVEWLRVTQKLAKENAVTLCRNVFVLPSGGINSTNSTNTAPIASNSLPWIDKTNGTMRTVSYRVNLGLAAESNVRKTILHQLHRIFTLLMHLLTIIQITITFNNSKGITQSGCQDFISGWIDDCVKKNGVVLSKVKEDLYFFGGLLGRPAREGTTSDFIVEWEMIQHKRLKEEREAWAGYDTQEALELEQQLNAEAKKQKDKTEK
jgi:hypothetical protein